MKRQIGILLSYFLKLFSTSFDIWSLSGEKGFAEKKKEAFSRKDLKLKKNAVVLICYMKSDVKSTISIAYPMV